ncbi:MAG: cytochrome c [Chloroflexi bacterium]|nr:cytochrome c [Chloroflexota bacterium]
MALKCATGIRVNGCWVLLLLLLLAITLVIPRGRLSAAPLAQSPEEGQALFQQKCAACHTIGQGDRVGPDLKGVADRRDRDWLTQFISAPDRVIAQGDPIATELLKKYNNVAMPNPGLTEGQVAAAIAYLGTQSGGAPAPQPTQAPAQAVPSGNPTAGKDLFTGVTRFQDGGPPCMACHSISGIGALGGGALGPDLTQTYTKFGEAGLASILASPPFPTMSPIYSSHPLTPEEQANLKAFFQQAAVAERPTQAVWQLAILAVAGVVVLLVLASFIWRRRLLGVRRPLVRRGE